MVMEEVAVISLISHSLFPIATPPPCCVIAVFSFLLYVVFVIYYSTGDT